MSLIWSNDTGQRSAPKVTFHHLDIFTVSVRWVIQSWYAMEACPLHLNKQLNPARHNKEVPQMHSQR